MGQNNAKVFESFEIIRLDFGISIFYWGPLVSLFHFYFHFDFDFISSHLMLALSAAGSALTSHTFKDAHGFTYTQPI